jgi:hypothetical protein
MNPGRSSRKIVACYTGKRNACTRNNSTLRQHKKKKEYPSQTQQSLVLQKLVNERTKYDKEQRSM